MPSRVLIVGADHPHRGATGKLDGELVQVAGVEMARVDLDQEGIGGASSCYAEAKDLRQVALDYRSEAGQ